MMNTTAFTIHWPWGWLALAVWIAALAYTHWLAYRTGRDDQHHDEFMARMEAARTARDPVFGLADEETDVLADEWDRT